MTKNQICLTAMDLLNSPERLKRVDRKIQIARFEVLAKMNDEILKSFVAIIFGDLIWESYQTHGQGD